jgi:hypothetical protein
MDMRKYILIIILLACSTALVAAGISSWNEETINPTTVGGTSVTASAARILANDYAGMRTTMGVQTYDADLATYAGITPSAVAQRLLLLNFAQILTSTGAQAADADLTTYAGITPSASAQRLLLLSFAQILTSTGAQPLDTDLSTYSGITPSANAQRLLLLTFAQLATTLGPAFDFALTADADAGDYDILSIDKLEGVDATEYIDMGGDGYVDIYAGTSIRAVTGTLAVTGAVTVSAGLTANGAATIGDGGDAINVVEYMVTANTTYSGTLQYYTTSSGITPHVFGQPVHITSVSKVNAANATAATTSPAIGVLIDHADNTANQRVLVHGIIANTAWTWTPGAILYLQDTPATTNGFRETAPSTTGHQVQIMGMAISATQIFVNPQLILIEIK